MTSSIKILGSRLLDNKDELTTVLESLPSYESLIQTSDEPPVFDDEKEPATGLIDLIRRNSQADDAADTITTVGKRQKKEIHN
jgi:hypothetical protein